MERGRLRVGDLILLKQVKGSEGWLSADGIIDIECHSSSVATLENSLWQVIVQRQYSAASELEQALLTLQIDHQHNHHHHNHHDAAHSSNPSSPVEGDLTAFIEKDPRLLQLSRTAQNEKRLNKKLMQMKIGKAISFGDVIQLLHVKSQKVLSISPYMLAKHERENLRVYLKEDGDTMSWLELMPKFKYDKEGQPVANGNECIIRIHEKSSDYLHVSKKSFRSSGGERNEINCSLESSVWSISIYQSALNIKSNSLLCGNLVTFHEPETSTYLQIQPEEDSQLSNSPNSCRVTMSESIHLPLSSLSSSLSSAQSIENIGTQFLWQIESIEILTGGILKNSVGKYVLKNINHNLYLKFDSSRGISAVKNRQDCTHFEMVVPYQMSYGEAILDGTLTQITAHEKTIGFCKNSSGLFELGSCYLSDRMTLSFQLSAKLHQHLSSQIYVGREATDILKRFYFHFLYVHKLLTTRHSINTFSINLITDESLLNLFSEIESNIKEIIVCLDFLKSYLQYLDINYSSLDEETAAQENIESENKSSSNNLKSVLGNQKERMITIRQVMIREQGVLDILLAIIDLLESREEDIQLSPIGLLRHSYSSTGSPNRQTPDMLVKKKSSKSIPQFRTRPSVGDEVASIDKDLSRLCLHVLYLAINKNHGNQMYIADRFTVLLNQVKAQEYAVTCVREMLRDNRQMLQTKITGREVAKFLELLRESPMNVILLKLLRSTCSCPIGVDSTQRMVAAALFRLKDDDLARSVTRASQLIRMLTAGEGIQEIPCLESPSHASELIRRHPVAQNSENRRLTWSTSSPLTGFNLKPREGILQEVSSFTNLVIKVTLSSAAEFQNVSWADLSIYLPVDEEDLKHVLGNSIICHGLQPIFASWADHEHYDMKTLFGSNEKLKLEEVSNLSSLLHQQNTPVVQINPTLPANRQKTVIKKQRRSSVSMLQSTGGAKKRKSLHTRIKTVHERKLQVFEYLVAQFYLTADLCLDRNYVAIGLLEETYPIDLLYTILKAPSLPNRLKAPVCKLIRTLYLDREPQIASKYPRLVRTSISLTGGVEGSFSDHHSGNPYTFAVLQQLISEYLHDSLNSKKCDELSSEMIELLFALMKFGFYHSSEQLKDIIVPLVRALEIHQFDDDDLAGVNNLRRRSSILNLITRRKSLLTPTGSPSTSQPEAKPSQAQNGEISAPVSSTTQNPNPKRRYIWQTHALNFLESFRALTLILILITYLLVHFLLCTLLTWPSKIILLDQVDFSISLLLVFEFLFRLYCFGVVNRNITSFFSSKFHLLDFSVVCLDFLLICVNSQINRDQPFPATLLVIRGLRLVRILRAVRLLKKIAEKSTSQEHWSPPARYNQASPDEIRTIAGILRVLAETYDIIHDRKLTSCIKAFIEWKDSDSNPFTFSPALLPSGSSSANHHKVKLAVELFQKHLQVDEELSNLFPRKFDTILTDIIMYSDETLVKESLNILLLNKNHEEILLESMRRIQLLYTPKTEFAYKNMSNALKQIQRMAEAYEVWCDLRNPNEISVALTAEKCLQEILQYIHITKPAATQEFDITPTCYVNVEVQQMLTNLNMISTVMLLQNTLLDTFDPSQQQDPDDSSYPAGSPSPTELIKKILIASNQLITEYIRNNEDNQIIVFQHFEWFLNKIDDGIGCSKVIRNVLSRNRYLIKQCQRKYMAEIMQKIISNGRRPEYLDYFIGLTDIPDVEDSSLAFLHNDITRYITHSERSSYILLWCCSKSSTAYQERQQMMSTYLSPELSHCPEEELPSELQYHINLLTLLASCKLGPKIQAIYPLDDIVTGIVDPQTIWHVRIPLVGLLLEAVNSSLEGLESADSLWRYFDYFEKSVHELQQNFLQLISAGSSPSVSYTSHHFIKLQHSQQWLSIGLCIIIKFFSNFNFELFYELVNFQSSNGASDMLIKVTERTEYELKLQTHKLFLTLQRFQHKNYKYLSKFTKKMLDEAILSWTGLGENDPFIDNVLNSTSSKHNDNNGGGANPGVSGGSLRMKDKRKSITSMRRASVQAEVQQVLFRQQYNLFIGIILQNNQLQNSIKMDSVELFERLPSIHNSHVTKTDIRLEPFIFKLSSYLRNSLIHTNTSRRYHHPQNTNTATWILSTLRSILEKNLSIRMDELCDPQHELIQEGVTTHSSHHTTGGGGHLPSFHQIINSYGITQLCLELIAVGIQHNLVNEAVKLLTVLLAADITTTPMVGNSRVASASSVQETIHRYLANTDSTLFFEELRDLFEYLRSWCQKEEENFDQDNIPTQGFETSSPSVGIVLPDAIYSLTLMSFMIHGNHLSNKLILKEQDGNSRHVNILDHLSSLTELLCRMNRLIRHCDILVRVLDVILSLVLGPCPECQEYLILHTELLLSLNRLLKLSSSSHSPSQQRLLSLTKEYAIDIIRGAIEGVSINNVIVEKVQTSVEYNVITEVILISPAGASTVGQEKGVLMLPRKNNINKLQQKYLILLKTLNKFTSSLTSGIRSGSGASDLATSSVLSQMEKDIGCIEIVWNQVLYKHYFFIPFCAQELPLASKQKLLSNIDFISHERKLNDFIKKSSELHHEGIHQERLKALGLVNIWSMKILLTYIMLANICAMNVLLTMHYILEEDKRADRSLVSEVWSSDSQRSSSNHDATTSPFDLHLPSDIRSTINSLLVFHLILTSIALVIIFIVRVPLSFSAVFDHTSTHKGSISSPHRSYLFSSSLLYAIFSPLTFWYITHLTIAWVAYRFHPLFVTFLILEYIAIDQTTNEVLLTVINPWRLILTTMALFLIFLYIFAVITFIYYRNLFNSFLITSLWDSFKIMLTYGFRTQEGISEIMFTEINQRIVYDIGFYLVIVVILRNVLFGIIIDNNAELRFIKMERENILNNFCFICGINQQDFDKRSSHRSNFKVHCAKTHHLWHYMSFLMKLWSQRRKDDTSVEAYIRNCIRYHDISWFPIGMIGIDEDVDHTNQVESSATYEKGAGERNAVPQVSVENHRSHSNLQENIENLQRRLMTFQSSQQQFLSGSSGGGLDLKREAIEAAIQREIEPFQTALLEINETANQLLEKINQLPQKKVIRLRKQISRQPSEGGDNK